MFKFFKMWFWKGDMEAQSNWFDKHTPAQARFEENEDWLEELEDRIIKLEEDSHPPVAAGGATELLEQIIKIDRRLTKLEENIGRIGTETLNSEK